MRTQLTSLQFAEILTDQKLVKPLGLDMFQALYNFENHEAAASEIAKLIGQKSHAPLNSEIGRMAKRIGEKYEIGASIRENQKFRWWDLFFTGRDVQNRFIWRLRPELISAMEETGLTGDIRLPEEVTRTENPILSEGAMRHVQINAYERNPIARRRCLEHWGYACSVCDLKMENVYGDLGKNFIHVHHLTPISSKGKVYEIDPIKDLRPVCPNCHAMIHKGARVLSIDELRAIVLPKSRTLR